MSGSRVLISVEDSPGWDDVGTWKDAPRASAPTPPQGLATDQPTDTRKDGPMPTIVAGRRARNPYRRGEPQSPEATIAHLQELLAEAIDERDDLRARLLNYYVPEVDRHWFVDPDDTGYCLACNLPWANVRHVERSA